MKRDTPSQDKPTDDTNLTDEEKLREETGDTSSQDEMFTDEY